MEDTFWTMNSLLFNVQEGLLNTNIDAVILKPSEFTIYLSGLLLITVINSPSVSTSVFMK